MLFYPDKKEFLKNAKQGQMIPVFCEILADLETPVSAFHKIADHQKYSFLLESMEGGEHIGRYSFIGCDPLLAMSIKDGQTLIQGNNMTQREATDPNNPLKFLRDVLNRYEYQSDDRLPRFSGGAVGFIGYGFVNYFQNVKQDHSKMDVPDACFMMTDTMLIFDHLKHRIQVVAHASVEHSAEIAYDQAIERIQVLIQKLSKPAQLKPLVLNPVDLNNLKSNVSLDDFCKMVEKAKEYIKAGDIFQVVLSQRFAVPLEKGDAFKVYRALRAINPSPYMFYLKLDDMQLVGSSPEVMVRSENGQIELRPIAGTRPRGKTEEEDLKFEKDLLNDPKELAEHIMLVDLGRNDVGRVAEYSSVHMAELMKIERYSHVMHIVSDVRGNLLKGKDAVDVLKATFPAGTVTGAPKVRAMQIIEELENTHRGPYAGSVGYFSFSGNLDSCITIRTIVVKDGTAYIQAGAGIVADSNPVNEYQETCNKAKALIRAIYAARE